MFSAFHILEASLPSSDGNSSCRKFLGYGRCFWRKTWKATIEAGASFAWRLQQWTSCMMGPWALSAGFTQILKRPEENCMRVVSRNFLHSSLTHACFEDDLFSALRVLYFCDEPPRQPNSKTLWFRAVPTFSSVEHSFHSFLLFLFFRFITFYIWL